jgi:hypothetical protein
MLKRSNPSIAFLALLAIGFFGSAACASTTYQITITPTFLINGYGPGESANQFVSDEFNIVGNLPPMFSDIQVTFTTTPPTSSPIWAASPTTSVSRTSQSPCLS